MKSLSSVGSVGPTDGLGGETLSWGDPARSAAKVRFCLWVQAEFSALLRGLFTVDCVWISPVVTVHQLQALLMVTTPQL